MTEDHRGATGAGKATCYPRRTVCMGSFTKMEWADPVMRRNCGSANATCTQRETNNEVVSSPGHPMKLGGGGGPGGGGAGGVTHWNVLILRVSPSSHGGCVGCKASTQIVGGENAWRRGRQSPRLALWANALKLLCRCRPWRGDGVVWMQQVQVVRVGKMAACGGHQLPAPHKSGFHKVARVSEVSWVHPNWVREVGKVHFDTCSRQGGWGQEREYDRRE